MALLLQLRSTRNNNAFTNPSLFHFFSSTTSNSNDDDPPPSNPNSPSSSYLNDLKKSLKQHQSTPSFSTPTTNPIDNSSSTFKASTLDEIRNNLTQFRRRVSDSDYSKTPSLPSSSQAISFQEIYKRNVAEKKSGEFTTTPVGKAPSFDAIRRSVNSRKQSVVSTGNNVGKDGGALSSFSIFAKEMREKEKGGESFDEVKMGFLKKYRHEELGEKLRGLRPNVKGGGGEWFSLRELNDRLVRLREMDEKENERSSSNIFGIKELTDAMNTLKESDNQARKRTLQGLDILGSLGRTPSFMLQPPKEHLVEKYFHPDNMSSAEKLKIDLARIRDEFKMSESDCGSFRVQVAQLTTKIKHLSSVLHKKDKHSRKGLIAMVQKRKRLLKYLRRTDWDSYCFVISKLGLRDNPDTKY